MPEPINAPQARINVSTDALNARYLELLHDWSLWNESADDGLRRLIETISAALDVHRVSIWAYSPDRRSLTLQHLYDRRYNSFSSGQELLQHNFPSYFDVLASGRLIDVADLMNDPRTRELRDVYSKPLGLGALLDATLRLGGQIWGVICIEQCDHPRIWGESEKNFAQSIADLISQVISFHSLRSSERQLRHICDHLSVGIVRTDFEGNCTYVNQYWSELANASTEHSLGNGWLHAVAVEDRALLQRGLADVAQGVDKFEVEFRLRSQGHTRWISSHWVLERNADGFPIGVLGGCFESTREKLSMRRLREMTTLQQAILDNANHSIITTDLDGVITSFNHAAEILLGYSEHEMVGRNSPAIFHDPDEISQRALQLSTEFHETIAPGFDVFIANAQRGLPEEREWTYVHKEGKRFPVSLSISALRGEDGSLNGYLGIAADLTERRRAEHTLLENEQRYRAVFEGSGDALFLMSNDTFIDCNQTTLKMFGCKREDIVGVTPLRFSPPLQPDGRASSTAASTYINAALSGEYQYFEWLHCRLDGTAFEAEVTLTAVQIGSSTQVVAVVRDISARKKTERELAAINRHRSWINQVGFELSNLHTTEAVAQKAVDLLVDVSGADLISLFNLENNTIRVIAEHGFETGTIERLPVSQLVPAPTDEIIKIDRPVYIDDISTTALLKPHQIKHVLKRGTRAVTLIPLLYQGLLNGVVLLEYKASQLGLSFANNELNGFAITVAFALASARHLEELAYRAEHDSLTQLPNRAVLQSALNSAIAAAEPLVLMLLDLDRFKEVNDTLGHHIGDKLLCELGARLNARLDSSGALLCRLGGDEFAVLLRGSDKQRGLEVARDLLRSMRQGYVVDGITLEIGVSIGIACFPQHGTNYHDLLRAADVAMYAAKNNALGVVAYAPKLDANSRERLRLMTELGHAIRNRELVLHYQPKILLGNNIVTSGYEALVRWQHPRAGLLPPAEFVPMAEISDTIHALTLEVLRQALAQQNIWRAQGHPAVIAVNLSTRNLLHAEFFDEVQALLRDSDADPKLLELEITETALMQDPAGAAAMLGRFAAIGVNIAIDDFGTGYSSLAYLRKLPLHALKIDRTFVTELSHNAQDQVIVRSIITLAHNLNLQVVAEGVEDDATLAMLREMGCDCAQGYLFARPQPAAEISAWQNNFSKNTRTIN